MCMDISVIIPVYNSERSLRELYSRLTLTLSRLCDNYELIFVDDGSRDDSFVKMCELHDTDVRVKAIRLQRNFGQQNAIMCGLRYSSGEIVVTIDDDLQNPPEEVEKLIGALHEGYDAVYGIPLEKMHPAYRNLGAAARDRLFGLIFRKPSSLKLSSFRAMDRNLVEKVIRDRTSFVYISAIILKNTLNIGNVPVKHDARVYGGSNYKLFKLVRLFVKLFFNYSGLTSAFADTSRPQFKIKDMRL